MICYDIADLQQLFESPSREKLIIEMAKSNYSTQDLIKDPNKIQEITDKIGIIKDKEDKEIFSAIYMFSKFYKKDTKVCYPLKEGADFNKINTLKELKVSIKENSITDFNLITDKKLRPFQLKSYLGNLNFDELFTFLKKVLLHYCNDINNINLLVNLQPPSLQRIPDNFFEDIHINLKTLNLKGNGHIIISYNDNNEFSVMKTVYPIIGNTVIPFNEYK